MCGVYAFVDPKLICPDLVKLFFNIWTFFEGKSLSFKLWLLFDKRAKLDLKSTKGTPGHQRKNTFFIITHGICTAKHSCNGRFDLGCELLGVTH